MAERSEQTLVGPADFLWAMPAATRRVDSPSPDRPASATSFHAEYNFHLEKGTESWVELVRSAARRVRQQRQARQGARAVGCHRCRPGSITVNHVTQQLRIKRRLPALRGQSGESTPLSGRDRSRTWADPNPSLSHGLHAVTPSKFGADRTVCGLCEDPTPLSVLPTFRLCTTHTKRVLWRNSVVGGAKDSLCVLAPGR